MLTLYAGTSGDRIRELEEVAIDELRRAADGFAPAEVARAQAQMTAGLVMWPKPLAGPSGWRAPSPPGTRQDAGRGLVARIAAVTPEEVRAFGETLLRRARRGAARTGQEGPRAGQARRKDGRLTC